MIKNYILYLLSKGETFKSISEIMNVTYQTVQAYVYKGINPKLENLVKLAEHFNVSFDFILGYKSEQTSLFQNNNTSNKIVGNSNTIVNITGNGNKTNIKQ